MVKTDFVLVLDLDETLVHTFDDMTLIDKLKLKTNPKIMDIRMRSYIIELIDPVGKKGKGRSVEMWGVFRPHLDTFLEFAFAYFRMVVVWSAGKRRYVDAIVEKVFKYGQRPYVVYSYDECKEFDSCYNKPLQSMIDDHPAIGPLDKIFVVDDLDNTFARNKSNAIHIPKYNPKVSINNLRSDDNALLKIKYWFLQPEVYEQDSAYDIEKDDIFKNSLDDYIDIWHRRNKMIRSR